MIIAVICATLAASVRLLLLQVYGPVAYSDTPSYRRLAEAVLNGFQRYDGTRTPGYPIFLALVGGDQQVYIVQLMLGFLTTLLLFWIGWRLTQNAWVAGAMGLANSDSSLTAQRARGRRRTRSIGLRVWNWRRVYTRCTCRSGAQLGIGRRAERLRSMWI